MVASVKTPLILVDFGSALKDVRTDTENLCFWSLRQHRPYLTHHSKTNTQQSSFLQPLSCGPHTFPILSTQPVWHGVMEMDYGPMICWEVDLKFTRLEAMGVMCWSDGVSQDGKSHVQVDLPHVSHCQPSPVPPQNMTVGLVCLQEGT